MDAQGLQEALKKGAIPEVKERTQAALDEGASPKAVLDILIGGMDEIGKKFKNNEIFIPEVLIAAKAMHGGLSILEPLLSESGVAPAGKICIGTVKGDLHDIGKNLVSMMFRGAGFEVTDLGIDVPVEKFVESAQRNTDIVAMSSLLTTSMGAMKEVVKSLTESGVSGRVKTMVGGAPVTEEFARTIGADGYAGDASSAVEKARELITSLKRPG